ncbi:MAG: glycosyl-4,4'-diaponeurosporenoate acyltransferase [Clostridia bacterium]|nr:glycosyl-4,4'-diaponeurosporenoate acyltransferase [Clostridia bacterium]
MSDTITVLLFFIVWPILQVGSALICLYIPDKFFNNNKGIYKTQKFEKNGKIYDDIFKVKKWKHLLPDGGAIYKKKGYAKKKLSDYSTNNLIKFLIESCRAELTHWLPISLFWVFFLFTTPLVGFFMFVYSIIVNLPCIFAQRYNRPRIARLLESINKKV